MNNPSPQLGPKEIRSKRLRYALVTLLVLLVCAVGAAAVINPSLFRAALVGTAYRASAPRATVTPMKTSVTPVAQPASISQYVIERVGASLKPLETSEYIIRALDAQSNTIDFANITTLPAVSSNDPGDMISNVSTKDYRDVKTGQILKVFRFDLLPTTNRKHRLTATLLGPQMQVTKDIEVMTELVPQLYIEPTGFSFYYLNQEQVFNMSFRNMTANQIQNCIMSIDLELMVANGDNSLYTKTIKGGSLNTATSVFSFPPMRFVYPGRYDIAPTCSIRGPEGIIKLYGAENTTAIVASNIRPSSETQNFPQEAITKLDNLLEYTQRLEEDLKTLKATIETLKIKP